MKYGIIGLLALAAVACAQPPAPAPERQPVCAEWRTEEVEKRTFAGCNNEGAYCYSPKVDVEIAQVQTCVSWR